MILLKRRKEKLVDGFLYRLCACGHCNEYFRVIKSNPTRKFAIGHNAYGNKNMLGKRFVCKNKGSKGKWIRTEKHNEKNSELRKEYFKSQENRKKASKKSIEHYSLHPETKQLISDKIKNKWTEDKDYREKILFGIRVNSKNEARNNKIRTSVCKYFKNPENRIKASLKNIEVWQREGHRENFWNWHGGISKTTGYNNKTWNSLLKEVIRNRDGNVCQICLAPEDSLDKILAVHHIDYDKDNCEESNLISLCNSCHAKTNNNREKWQSVFAIQ